MWGWGVGGAEERGWGCWGQEGAWGGVTGGYKTRALIRLRAQRQRSFGTLVTGLTFWFSTLSLFLAGRTRLQRLNLWFICFKRRPCCCCCCCCCCWCCCWRERGGEWEKERQRQTDRQRELLLCCLFEVAVERFAVDRNHFLIGDNVFMECIKSVYWCFHYVQLK